MGSSHGVTMIYNFMRYLKENLSSNSSINTPEVGIKNAAEDNKLKSSINTPERVEPLEASTNKSF